MSQGGLVVYNAPILSPNVINLPNTTNTGIGVINFGGVPFVQNYGTSNTFLGANAGNTTLTVANAVRNNAVGNLALDGLTTGNNNEAFGYNALSGVTTGTNNIGIGSSAGFQITTGVSNILIGLASGQNYTGAETSNIIIGNNSGVLGESSVIRIGAAQTTCYIQGIAGVTVANSAAVLINTVNGQLGTIASSRRFKDDIKDLGNDSEAIMRLRPTSFVFKGHEDLGRQSGLIAEEVKEVMSSLLIHDAEGRPASVKYHDLPVLLLNELQKLRSEVDDLKRRLHGKS